MKTKNKFLGLALVLCMVLSMAVMPVHAAIVDSGTCGANLTWTLDDNGTLTISGTGAMDDWKYKDNGSLEGSCTTPWIERYYEINEITINNGVTSIGNFAFAFTWISGITIPDSVTSIGRAAFYCSGLTSITIPDSVTSIGENAFGWCYSHKSIYVSDGNANYSSQDGVLFNKNKTKIICFPNGKTGAYTIPDSVTSLDDWEFYYCRIDSVTIGNGITSIGYMAFFECDLDSVTIPYGVTNIEASAFGYCTSLRSIRIPSSVTSIGPAAFESCSSLTSITIPDSVTRIGGDAFRGCSSLSSITIPDSVTSIGNYAFSDTAWYDNQPDGVVYAGKVAYEYKGTMPENTSIVLKSGTKGIADGAFSDCSNLISVTIPDSVTNIGDSAFEYCRSLSSITIPNSVTRIGNWAFYSCSSLTSVTIGNGVTSIGSEFIDCSSLASITIPDSVTSIDERAFAGTAWYDNQPDGLVYAGKVAYEYKGTMPENTSIVLKSDTKGIADYAFGNSSLSSITIPDSVTSIGRRAFYYCRSLTSVTIPDSVTSIGDETFYNCGSLTSVTIGNGVTSIGKGAFNGCSSLNDVYYDGTQKGWESIKIGSNNHYLTDANIHFIFPSTETTITKKPTYSLINTTVRNVKTGNKVLIATYKSGKIADLQVETYDGEDISAATFEPYDTVKVMVWDGIETMKPLGEGEELN